MKAPEAGNTAETLAGQDVNEAVAAAEAAKQAGLPTEADLDAVAKEKEIAAQTGAENETGEEEDIEVEFDEYVTRAEFDELVARIDAFNTRSSHKI